GGGGGGGGGGAELERGGEEGGDFEAGLVELGIPCRTGDDARAGVEKGGRPAEERRAKRDHHLAAARVEPADAARVPAAGAPLACAQRGASEGARRAADRCRRVQGGHSVEQAAPRTQERP